MSWMRAYTQHPITIRQETSSYDDFGNVVISTTPLHIWGGVNDGDRMTRNDKGEEVHSDLQVMIDANYGLECWILAGEHSASATPTSDARRPVSIKAMRMIVGGIIGYGYNL